MVALPVAAVSRLAETFVRLLAYLSFRPLADASVWLVGEVLLHGVELAAGEHLRRENAGKGARL